MDTCLIRTSGSLWLAPLLAISWAVPFAVKAETEPESLLEEVIVIAQKREQNQQDVPVAVSVLDREMIEESGILSVTELTELNPSVSFDTAQSFQNSSLKIRGIGTVGNGRTFEGSVGVFVDGVYRSRSGMALLDMLDIERIEVARGPQGTLFGKNTVAGALYLSSRRPYIGETGGEFELRGGEHDQRYASGAINLVTGSDSALRLAASVHRQDGYIESPDTGETFDETDRHALRAQWLFEPHDDLSVLLQADYAESDANCCWSSAQVVNGPLAPVVATYAQLNGLSFIPAPQAEQQRLSSLNTSPREIVRDRGIAATVEWSRGDFDWKSITAVRQWDHEQRMGDADFTGADLLTLDEPARIDQLSQEFNLSFQRGDTDWLLGLYYAQEDYEGYRTVFTSPDTDNYLNTLISAGFGAQACLPPVVALDCLFPVGIGALLDDGELSRELYTQDAESLAGFMHAVHAVNDRNTLVFGLRYSIEDKDGGVRVDYWYDSFIARATLAQLGLPDDGTPRNGLDIAGTFYSPSFTAATRDEELTGTLAWQHFPSDELMMYAKYDRGYKAGGVNLFREAVVTNTRTYAPETADSFEIGMKHEWWGGRARSNIAAFHTRFEDLQINFFDGLNFRTENTGEASTTGLEIENRFQLSDALHAELAMTWLDATFDTILAPELAYLQDRDTPRAPGFAGVAGLGWERALAGGRELFARGLLSYTGSHYVGADVATEQKAGAYTVADLSLGLRDPDGGWEVVAWCRNCGDEDYRTILFNSTFQAGSQDAFLNAPRRYGVTFRAWF